MSESDSNGVCAGRDVATRPWWMSPGLASLLGLGPLLAASRSFATGLALGLASLAVLCAGNVLAAVLGRSIPPKLRLPAFLLLIAALVTAVDLLFQARWFDLHGQVALFVPLIVTNCLIVARAEAVAAGPGWWQALLDGLGHGAGFTLLLAGLGALRALLAPGLLIATLPAGALFLLAALVALHQVWLGRRAHP